MFSVEQKDKNLKAQRFIGINQGSELGSQQSSREENFAGIVGWKEK